MVLVAAIITLPCCRIVTDTRRIARSKSKICATPWRSLVRLKG
jgi:hypothetical protein